MTLGEITDRNREAVLALRVAPGQERFVGSVRSALAQAAGYPHAKPWYRVVCAGGEPVGFVMVSWDGSRSHRRSSGRGSCGNCSSTSGIRAAATARRSSGRSRNSCGPRALPTC